jgi:predicted 3-demethylubiquinone-9 3-methyltransferase (glyoxalase superfamily)
MQEIQPFLWFNDNAEEAVRFYLSVFENGKAGLVTRWGEGGPVKPGSVLTATFTIGDLEFVALNAGTDEPARMQFPSSSPAIRRRNSTKCGQS